MSCQICERILLPAPWDSSPLLQLRGQQSPPPSSRGQQSPPPSSGGSSPLLPVFSQCITPSSGHSFISFLTSQHS